MNTVRRLNDLAAVNSTRLTLAGTDTMFRWRTSLTLALLLAQLLLPASAQTPLPQNGDVLAWVRFDEATQLYRDTRYRFLGDAELRLTVAVAPAAGHALDLLWGAKGDQRSAVLVLDGRELVLRAGGYDGFRWLRVPLPAVTAARYELTLKPSANTAERPAFLAEVRLTDSRTTNVQPRSLSPALSKVGVRWAAPVSGEAFPQMRARWDREPERSGGAVTADEALFRQAERNGRRAAEAFYRCRRFVEGWLQHADPKTGLIPRNLGQDRDLWNGRDAAADNYPFMVLTCALTDRPMFEGRMLEMLRTELRVTRRLDRLGDNYSFAKQGFARERLDLDQLIFDNAEYVKDGLIPLTEWLGPSPWSERMVGIIEDIWKQAAVETPFGKIPTLNLEVNGDLMQSCSRLFWFTGERKFLEWGLRLSDYYLLGTNVLTRDLPRVSLIDHGCEVINGLSELYLAASRVAPEKKAAYAESLRAIYDALLAKGRNEHGLLYVWFDAKSGEHHPGLCDTWGYDYDGLYTLFLVEGRQEYRAAVREALSNLKPHYTGYRWVGGVADGYADAIEGALNLYNREPVAGAAEWMDGEIRDMWAIQKPDGVIEGWHGDGNFARTSLMYALWKTQGLRLEPWRADVRIGAVRDGERLLVSLASDEPWTGKLVFDQPRHRTLLHLPLDYPRINQFPEWFTVESGRVFEVAGLGPQVKGSYDGGELIKGVALVLEPKREARLVVK